jgi:hypothetical protein
MDPQITQIARFHEESKNLFRETGFRKFIVQILGFPRVWVLPRTAHLCDLRISHWRLVDSRRVLASELDSATGD